MGSMGNGGGSGGALSSRRGRDRESERDEADYDYEQDDRADSMQQHQGGVGGMDDGGYDGGVGAGGYAGGQPDRDADVEYFAAGEHPLEAAVPNFTDLPNPEPLAGKTK